MKKAIVTLDSNYVPLQWLHWSRPLFKLYATKVGANYVEIAKPKINLPAHPVLEKLQLYDVLNEYDRVVYFDADILVQPQTPNLFNIVSFENVGAVYDCPDNNEHNTNRARSIANIKSILGEIDWVDGYINAGMMVLSRDHQDVFKFDPKLLKADPKLLKKMFLDQDFINYNIKKNKLQIHKLPRSFNRITFSGNDEEFYEHGELAYVVHFAGKHEKAALMQRFFRKIVDKQTLWERVR